MSQKEDVIKKIKSKGYWMINIHPEVFIERRIEPRSKVKEIIRNAVISLRGWDYPHFFDVKEHEPYSIENGIESFKNWENHIEFWRMTQSANFAHLLALREDWMKGEVVYQNIFSRGDELKDKKLLGVFCTLYTLTEIFEFAKRLARKNIFDENMEIKIDLYDLFDRHLFVEPYNKVPLSFPRVSRTNGPWKWSKSYTVEDILNKTHEFSFNAFIDLVDLFGWENPPVDSLKNDQQKFLQGKI